MKRILFMVVLFVGFSAYMFAGGQKEAAKKITIVDYHWTETAFNALNEHAVKVFEEKHPNVTVKLLLLPDADRAAKIRTALAANGDIDAFALTNAESAEFLSEHQMVPIDPAAFGKTTVQDVVKMWTPGSIQATGGYWDGQYYGIPIELDNYVAWVNTADMKAAGLNPSDLPKTWEEFAAMAKKLTVDQNGVRVRNGFENNSKAGVFNFLVLTSMMEQLGLDWGTDKGFLASMDHPNTLERGLRTYTDLVTKSKVWDPALNDNDREGFGDNKTATFLTGGSWYWGVLKTYSVPTTDAEPFPYPRFADGKDIGGPGYGYCLYVSRLAKHPKLTWEWLDTMASQPNAFLKLGLYQPRLTLSNGSPGVDLALAAKYLPYWNQVFEPELQKTAIWLSSVHYQRIEDAVWAAISRVIYQGVSVDDSVAQLQTAIRSILQ